MKPEGTDTIFRRTKLDTSFNNTCPGGVDEECGEDPFCTPTGLVVICWPGFCWPINATPLVVSPSLIGLLMEEDARLDIFAMFISYKDV